MSVSRKRYKYGIEMSQLLPHQTTIPERNGEITTEHTDVTEMW